jgi:Flp pilus assembly protein TadD
VSRDTLVLRNDLQDARALIEGVRDSGVQPVDKRVQADLDLCLASLNRAEDRLGEHDNGWSE